MANKKITDLTSLGADAAAGDFFEMVDTSDTTDSAQGTSKKVTRNEIIGSVLASTTATFTTSDETKLDGIEASADVTDEDNVKAALNGASISTATVSASDKVLILDADDSDNLKLVSTQSIADLAAGGGGISDVVEDTSPQLGGQLDVNGNAIGDGTNELLTFTEDASAVNHINIENEATGSGPKIQSVGDDTNIDLNLEAKGSGVVKADGVQVATTTGTETLTNKTIDAANNTLSLTADSVDSITEIASAIKSGSDGTLVTGTAGTSGNLVQWDANGDAIDSSLVTSDVVTGSSTDTFTNKTFDANGTGNSISNIDVADLADGTDGELITWDASGAPATVSAGTSGQVLTSNGAGAAPTFEDAAGGGSGAFATASNVTSNSPGTIGTDDFVFGSTQLDDDGDTAHDYRMFFDKSKGTLCAGRFTSSEVNDSVRGDYSLVYGQSTGFNNAAADNSLAGGNGSKTYGYCDIAIGDTCTSTSGGGRNVLIGESVTGTGSRTVAIGSYINTSSTNRGYMFGTYLKNASHTESMVIGLGLGGSDNATDRLTSRANNEIIFGCHSNLPSFVIRNAGGSSDNLSTIGFWDDNASDNQEIRQLIPAAKITTTDATVTTLKTISLADNTSYIIRANIVAKKSDSSDRAAYISSGLFYRDNPGGATQEGSTVVDWSLESEATWGGISFTTSSNDVLLQVTGLAATTVNWQGYVEVIRVQ